jgi:hypothetical protein
VAPTSGQVGILLTLNTALSGEGMSGQRVWIKIVFWIGALVIFEMAYAPARARAARYGHCGTAPGTLNPDVGATFLTSPRSGTASGTWRTRRASS